MVVIFIVGLCVGSFINVCIDRLPQHRSLWQRSRCPECRQALAWYDLIPLVSFAWLRGRCRYCKTAISLLTPAVELLTAGCYSRVFLQTDHYGLALVHSLVLSCSLVIFFIDYVHLRIPNSLVLCLLLLGLLKWAVAVELSTDAWAGMATGVIILGFAGLIGLLLPGRQYGFGMGDLKLIAALGLLFGVKGILLILILSVCSGAAIGLAGMMIFHFKGSTKIPFGSILSITTILILLGTPFSIIDYFPN